MRAMGTLVDFRGARHVAGASVTLLILAIAVTTLSPATTVAAGDGRIFGTVTNGTTGAVAPGQTVTLSRFVGQTPQEDLTTVSDASGSFEFTGLDTAPNTVYVASVNYSTVLYASGMVRIDTQPDQQANVTIFETTTDQSNLAVESRGIVITAVDSGTVTCLDVFALNFDSDRTLVAGDDGRTVRFPVPPTASEVSPGTGFNFGSANVVGATLYSTAPLYPGESTATLNWTLPYTGDAVDLSFDNAYPTGSIRFLVPVDGEQFDDTIRVTGAGIIDGGIVAVGSANYHVWTTGSVGAGASIAVRFEDLPKTADAARGISTVEPLAVVALAVAVAAALTVWTIRRKDLLRPRPVTLAPAVAAPLEQRRESLSEQLRSLESEWSTGAIDEQTYRGDRRAILLQLRSISRQMRGVGDDE
jgi:hypothetical protein